MAGDSDLTFHERDGPSAVYEVEGSEWPQHIPAKAKSAFIDEYDVDYSDCRATTVTVGTDRYVIVGCVATDGTSSQDG